MQELLALLHEEMDLGEPSEAVAVGTATTKPTDVERPQMASAVVIETGSGLAFDPAFASYGQRLGGLAVDVLVLTVLCLPGLALTIAGSGALVLLGVLLLVIGFGAATVIYAKGVSSTGQSFGNRASSTRVVDARNGQLVPVGEAGTRYVVRMLVSPILFIGFLVALGNSERRTFHDNIAGTVVIRPARASWSIDDEVST